MPVRGRKTSLDRLTDVVLTSPINGQVIKYDSGSGTWTNQNESGGGGGSGELVAIDVAQVAHGLALGEAVYFDGTDWQKAQANSVVTLGTGVVSAVTDVDNFTVAIAGEITGLTGLVSGDWYFVSDATAGLLTTTESSTNSNPLMFATSTTTAIVMPLRASTSDITVIGGTERLKWVDLINTWTTEPAEETYSGGDGEVLSYTYGSTVYYRFIPSTYDSTQDSFYTTFSDPTLSGIIATRGNTI